MHVCLMHVRYSIQSETQIEFKPNLGCLFLASSILVVLIALFFPPGSSGQKDSCLSVGSLTADTFRAKPQKRGNSLSVLIDYTRFWVSSKICQPLISLQNSQVVSFCILTRVYSYYLWEDQFVLIFLYQKQNFCTFYYDIFFALSP